MLSGSVLLAISSLLSRLLGVVRANRFAAYFGAGVESDAFFAAFQITDFLYNIIIFGAVSAAFVPIFSGYLAKKDMKNAWLFTNNLLNFLSLVLIGFSLIIFVFASQILSLLYPGFAIETLETATRLTRILLLSPLFFGIAGIAGSVQNAFHTFFAYAIAPLIYNICIIGGIIWLSPHFGIDGVIYGTVIGSFLYMAVQIPVMYAKGFRYIPILNVQRKDFTKAIMLAIPRIFGLAVYHVNLIIEGIIASTIAVGSLTIIRYSQDVQSFPIGIFGVSIAISSFGYLSRFAAEAKLDVFIEKTRDSLHKILFFTLPAATGLFILRHDIVTLLLRYGKFNEEVAHITTQVVGIMCLSLPFLSITPLLSRAFYALENTKTPVFVGVITIIINGTCGYILSIMYGIEGLAFGGVIAASIQAILLGFLLYKFLEQKYKNNINTKIKNTNFIQKKSILYLILSSFLMGVCVYYCHSIFSMYINSLNIISSQTLLSLIQILCMSAFGVIVFGLLTWNMQENKDMRKRVYTF